MPDDTLFSPPGIDWSPVSPKLATLRTVAALIWFGLATLAIGGVAIGVGQAWVVWFTAIPVLLGAWTVRIVRRQVRALGYAEREEDFLVRRGVLFRRLSVVPYGRMQYVDVSVGPLARAFHIASLEMHTAAVGLDVTLPGLPAEEASRLRDRLASRGEASLAGL